MDGLYPNKYQGIFEGLKFLKQSDQFDRQLAEKHWATLQQLSVAKEKLAIDQQMQAHEMVKWDFEKNNEIFKKDLDTIKALPYSQQVDYAIKKRDTFDREKEPGWYARWDAIAQGGAVVVEEMQKAMKVYSDLAKSNNTSLKDLLAAQSQFKTAAARGVFADPIKIETSVEGVRRKAKIITDAKAKDAITEKQKRLDKLSKELAMTARSYAALKKGIDLKGTMMAFFNKELPGFGSMARDKQIKAIEDHMAYLRREIRKLDPTYGGDTYYTFDLDSNEFIED